MKKIAKLGLGFVFLFSLMSGVSYGQSMKDYTWDQYSIEFKIPSDFTVTESESDKFIASNYEMNLSIYPRTGENLFFDGFKNALKSWVSISDVVVQGDYLKVTNLNGFVGAMVDAEKNGHPVFLMVVGNPKDLDVSLYVWIYYDAEDIDTAQDILYSISPMDK